ncbi:hypothetical protein HNQ64_001111 [Prosthecobacter dejongeii]|uniref:Uncharacterized protein n=1 Tax=Prosthecobacter dejongeii TaxID=48465 RepID=A0A7W7YIP2_9BACT|nr:hypothetical protein [Prosthecobacter dejongeii]
MGIHRKRDLAIFMKIADCAFALPHIRPRPLFQSAPLFDNLSKIISTDGFGLTAQQRKLKMAYEKTQPC